MKNCLIKIVFFFLFLSVGSWNVFSQHTAPAEAKDKKSKQTYKIKTVYDAVKNETAVFLLPFIVKEASGTNVVEFADGGKAIFYNEVLEMTAYLTYAGKSAAMPENVIIGFRSKTQTAFKYANNIQLTVEADNTQFKLGKVKTTNRQIVDNTF